MRFLAERLEYLVILLFLWVVSGILWPPLSYFSRTAVPLEASDPISAAAHALFIAFLVVALVVRRDEMLHWLRCAWPVLPLLALAFLSAFWSGAPELVLRRSATVAGTTLLAVYLAGRFDMARLVAMLVKLSAVGAVGSLIAVAVVPRLAVGGTIDYPTAWHGVYGAKNTLGGMSAFGVIFAVYALRHGYGSRLIAAAVIPVNLLLLHFSQSATPIILLVVAAYVAVMAGAFRQRNGVGFAAGFVLVAVGIAGLGFMALDWTEVLAALNRSATLTGRTQIWRMAIEFISRRPWVGYGFGAFWQHGEIEARTIWQTLLWIVPHAHNAWLEIGLDLGIAGMAGVTLLWLSAFYRGLRLLTVPRARHVVFCLALLTAMLVENLTEYEFFRGDSFNWTIFVLVFTYLGREILAGRLVAVERGAAAPPLAAVPLRLR